MGDQKWASDDAADDLLAGILDETATEAEEEEQRIQAEIEAKKQEEQRRKEEEERRKRQEAEQRLSAEKERLQEVEKRRTQKMEALRREELIESGEWVPPEEEEEEEQQEAQDQPPPEATQPPQQGAHPHGHPHQHPGQHHQTPGAAAAQSATGSQPVEEIPQKSNKGVMVALTLVVLGVIGAGAVAFFVLPEGYEIDATTYERTSFAPSETTTSVVEIGFQALPEEEDDPAPAARPSPRPAPSPSPSPAPAQEEEEEDDSPSIDLGGSDPFGSGF